MKQSAFFKYLLIILFLQFSLFISSCGIPAPYGDSVIYYKPKDWVKKEYPWYTKSYEELTLKITEMGGVTLKRDLIPELIINNQGGNTVILEQAILKTGNAEFSARPFGGETWEKIPANETRRLSLEFNFNSTIEDELKDPVEIILVLENGNDVTKISIPMIKSQ